MTAGLQDTDSFFYAASLISSSAEKSRLLTESVEEIRAEFRRGRFDFLTATATIESNAACADVLDAFTTRYQLAEEPVRAAFLTALNTVDSKLERGRLLEKVATDTR